MHQQRLIHRDVKPANIVWSCSQGGLVLCDFGVSCIVLESVGQKTLTTVEGTERYMTAELRCMIGEGYIDLYYNDMYALEMTANELQQTKMCKQPVTLPTQRKPPHPRVMFLKTLRDVLSGKQPNTSYFPNKLALRDSFPDIQLADSNA